MYVTACDVDKSFSFSKTLFPRYDWGPKFKMGDVKMIDHAPFRVFIIPRLTFYISYQGTKFDTLTLPFQKYGFGPKI